MAKNDKKEKSEYGYKYKSFKRKPSLESDISPKNLKRLDGILRASHEIVGVGNDRASMKMYEGGTGGVEKRASEGRRAARLSKLREMAGKKK